MPFFSLLIAVLLVYIILDGCGEEFLHRNATLLRFFHELFRKRRRNKDVLCHCYLLHFRDKALVFAIVDFFRFVLGLFLKFELYAHLLESFEDFVL